jgi:hypothetical protein
MKINQHIEVIAPIILYHHHLIILILIKFHLNINLFFTLNTLFITIMINFKNFKSKIFHNYLFIYYFLIILISIKYFYLKYYNITLIL